MAASFGGTAWMLALAVMAAAQGFFLPAAYVVALFAHANGVGVALWAQRHRFRLYTAMTWLMVACGMTGAAAIYILDVAGAWEAAQLEPWVYPAETGYVILAAVCLGAIVVSLNRARQ